MLAGGLASLLLVANGCSSGSSSGVTGKSDANTLIDVTGSIGGIAPRQPRSQVEGVLGPGDVVSRTTRHQKTGTYTLTRVRYVASSLTILYVQSGKQPARVFGMSTASPRYHTADGLRIGSSLSAARREHGIRCSEQLSYVACQGGLGYEKPVTSFTVKDGRVVGVFVVAVAD